MFTHRILTLLIISCFQQRRRGSFITGAYLRATVTSHQIALHSEFIFSLGEQSYFYTRLLHSMLSRPILYCLSNTRMNSNFHARSIEILRRNVTNLLFLLGFCGMAHSGLLFASQTKRTNFCLVVCIYWITVT